MDEDRVVGAGRNTLGKAEQKVGSTIGNDRLEGDGVVDKVAGAIQHGYGTAKDAVAGAVDDAPAMFGDAVDRGRALGQDADAAIRRELGDRGPLYILAAAAALIGAGLFAMARAGGRPKPKAKSAPRKRTAPKA